MSWVKTVPHSKVQNRPVVFRCPPKQLALFHVAGSVYAVDNRCPHEGYPLVQGKVNEGAFTLTCNWHNWKFRLSDGRCLLGSDHVRSYETRIQDDHVWVNLADPPIEVVQKEILGGLCEAFSKREYGRICRELSRLHFYDIDPMIAVRKSIEWSHNRLEFGFSHAYAAAADWLTLAQQFPEQWESRLICLVEPIDHMADNSLRHPIYAFDNTDEDYSVQGFMEAVETEDQKTAVGMVLRGLDRGLHWRDMHEAFATVALAHYNDFGHSMIYVYKTDQLIEHLGPEVEAFLLPSLARSLCYATREDLLPDLKKGYAGALSILETISWGKGTSPELLPYPSSTKQALEWVIKNAASHTPQALYQSLLEALARNLLHYDEATYGTQYDRPVSDNVSWLSFTHGITFANAVRTQCVDWPNLWAPGLLQIACFVGRNRPYLNLELGKKEWEVTDPKSFFEKVTELLLDHGLSAPIYTAHLIKTARAVQEEFSKTSDSCSFYLLAGLNRFLHSPIKQKHTRRMARQAIALVERDFKTSV